VFALERILRGSHRDSCSELSEQIANIVNTYRGPRCLSKWQSSRRHDTLAGLEESRCNERVALQVEQTLEFI